MEVWFLYVAVGFASLDIVCDELMIVPGMLVCSSFLISVCMLIVLKALLISSAAVIVRAMELELNFVCLFVCLVGLFHIGNWNSWLLRA